MSTVTCDETLGSRPSMLKNYCHTSIATQSSNQSIEAWAYQIPRNISSGQLHEILIAMSWASLICPDETDFLPSFLPCERPPEAEKKKKSQSGTRTGQCVWLVWTLEVGQARIFSPNCCPRKPPRSRGGQGIGGDKVTKTPPNESRATSHQGRCALFGYFILIENLYRGRYGLS